MTDVCSGCEGAPAPENDPCAVCGQSRITDLQAKAEAAADAVRELADMLDMAESEQGTVVFDHSPEEIGLHVMENYQAIREVLCIHSNRKARPMVEQETSEYCRKCGHDNPSWSAQSPLWNAVMRGGSIDGEALYGDMVCASCFMQIAERAGIADGWRLVASKINVPLEMTTPSGRVWNEDNFLWEDDPTVEQEAMQADRKVAERFGNAWRMNSAGKFGLGNLLAHHRIAATKAADERVRVLEGLLNGVQDSLCHAYCAYSQIDGGETVHVSECKAIRAALAEAGGRDG